MDLELYADGCPMTLKLHTLISEYDVCSMDEAPAEGEHRDIKRVLTAAAGSQGVWWAAGSRKSQVLLEVEDYIEHVSARKFISFWRSWKTILKTSHRDRTSRQFGDFSRDKRADVIKRVYRAYPWNMVDTSDVTGNIRPPQDRTHSPQDVTRTQLDFFKACLRDKEYVSMPVPSPALPAITNGEDMHASSDFSVFQIIDKTPGSKKTVERKKKNPSALPMTVQRFMAWRPPRYEASAPPALLDVFECGDPEEVDIMSEITWSVGRSSVFYWDCAQSDVDGCISLKQPTRITDRPWNHLSLEYPAFLMLMDVARRGFILCEKTKTPITDMTPAPCDADECCGSQTLFPLHS